MDGFILSRHWRDTAGGVELIYWVATAEGPLKVIVPGQKAVLFIDSGVPLQELLTSVGEWRSELLPLKDFTGRPVCAVYFKHQKQLRRAREILRASGCDPFEDDISPADRFLMERFIRGSVQLPVKTLPLGASCLVEQLKPGNWLPFLRVVSFDIETNMRADQLFSIAVYYRDGAKEFSQVFMLSSSDIDDSVICFATELELLQAFYDWLADYDPDVLIGWNVINFDCRVLQKLSDKCHLACGLGRGEENHYWQQLDDEGDRWKLLLPGRVVLDGIDLLKTATYQFDSFSLNAVAGQLLDDSKLLSGDDRGEKITDLFRHNKKALAEYNVHDCRLVWDIFEKTDLVQFAIARTRMTGLPLDRVGGSVAAFDFRYLPLLHRAGYVAPNGHRQDEIEHSPGGFVMDSVPGMYEHVLVLDFKSLYPSIIRSFLIDPLALAVAATKDTNEDSVPGFRGGQFDRESSLLPGIINELWSQRDKAKADNNKALSQAIKILMNSFYGVLGSAGCRFFDSRLASSITRRGHQIIQETAAYIEDKGWKVIYGDTDSVFVWLNQDCEDKQARSIGRRLAASLNQWWKQRLRDEFNISSALEMEFETHFSRFLMPTVRGSSHGSKKRYAGLVKRGDESELVFKGLETVRSDWTPLAKTFQANLYRKIFLQQSFHGYIAEQVSSLMSGESDSLCVYRKRLRRNLEDYQKNIPPHVQAARKLQQWSGKKVRRGDWVEYLVTVNGPEPVELQKSALDRQHYLDRQLQPVADSILVFLGESFSKIISRQLSMF